MYVGNANNKPNNAFETRSGCWTLLGVSLKEEAFLGRREIEGRKKGEGRGKGRGRWREERKEKEEEKRRKEKRR